MAHIVPFRALRPTPKGANQVASVPYDVVNRKEAAELAFDNPLSFLHVSRSEIDLPESVDPYSDAVYETATTNFVKLRKDAPLVVEEEPSLYFYRLRMGSHEQIGVVGCYSIDDYDQDLIKKHERTRRDKEDDRTRHIVSLRAQTGPVFLTYRASNEIDNEATRVISTPPLFDLVAVDGVQHTIWRLDSEASTRLVQAFSKVPALYIADGHHRAASAARARQELREREADGADVAAYNTFLGVAFPGNQMQILPYNRIVKDLAGLSSKEFLARVGEVFELNEGSSSPTRKGELAMFLDGTWHQLLPKSEVVVGGTAGLDVSGLQEKLLEPILGITDVRTDKRIGFVGGVRGAVELEKLVESGEAAVAFSMFPVTIEDLLSVSDANGIMPPKSTWFEPKLRDGLLIHEI